jgi:dephospho-CoA kinase
MAPPQSGATQRRIGLTGGIASGKSSVGALLAERGLPVLDADAFARDALAPGTNGTRSVLDRYGPRVRAAGSDGDGIATIDRAALGRIVFHDSAERRWLEELVHPLVRERFRCGLQQLTGAPTVVLMIPLLFEAGLDPLCTEIWLVSCEQEQQLERLMQRDGLERHEALARLEAQWPLERKRPLADVVIDNSGSQHTLPAQVAAALQAGNLSP